MSFLPPPPFNPIVPSGGLVRAVWKMLVSGYTLDHLGFLNDTGSWRLAAYVNELRGLGWPVQSTEVPRPTADNPHRHIAIYWLSDEAMHAAQGGQHGR